MSATQLSLSNLPANLAELLSPHSTPVMFNSGLFWVMMLVFIPVFAMVRQQRTRMMLWVTAFSLFFFYLSSGWYLLIMLATAVIDYKIAQTIAQSTDQQQRKRLLTASIVCSVGVLALFKYTNFFLLTWHDIVGGNFSPLHIVAPVGVSFYTFRTISYVTDVYHGRIKPVPSLLHYVFFLSFFPCLIAGPIVRAEQFMPQLEKLRKPSQDTIYSGMWQLLLGVVKKAVIADYLAQYTVLAFGNPSSYSGFELLMAVLCYSMQIYCDFSGYSDMAIGLGSIMGFDLGKNFDFPYRSRNITEFWRRWHISLSFWLRDYIYIPLGGNRRGKRRQYINLMVTMIVGGLWHGAAMRFILWGFLHGVALCIHKMLMPRLKQVRDNALVTFLSVLVTFSLVSLLWIFFAVDSHTDAFIIFSKLFTSIDLAYVNPFLEARGTLCVILLIAMVSHFIPASALEWMQWKWVDSHWLTKLAVLCAIVQLVITFEDYNMNPFIYAQF